MVRPVESALKHRDDLGLSRAERGSFNGPYWQKSAIRTASSCLCVRKNCLRGSCLIAPEGGASVPRSCRAGGGYRAGLSGSCPTRLSPRHCCRAARRRRCHLPEPRTLPRQDSMSLTRAKPFIRSNVLEPFGRAVSSGWMSPSERNFSAWTRRSDR